MNCQIKRRRRIEAFSLIEVVAALGVVAFALVSLMSLLPTGMSSFQKSRAINTQTEIVTKVITGLQGTPFGSIFVTNNVPYTLQSTITNQFDHSYDSDGLDITQGQSTNAPVFSVVLATNSFAGITSGLLDSYGHPVVQIVQINLVYHFSTNIYSTIIVNKGF